MSQFASIIAEAETALAAVATINDLEQVKARFLGKSGVLTEQLKQLGKLSAEDVLQPGLRSMLPSNPWKAWSTAGVNPY